MRAIVTAVHPGERDHRPRPRGSTVTALDLGRGQPSRPTSVDDDLLRKTLLASSELPGIGWRAVALAELRQSRAALTKEDAMYQAAIAAKTVFVLRIAGPKRLRAQG